MTATLETALRLATALATNRSSGDLRIGVILETLLEAISKNRLADFARHVAAWHWKQDAETAEIIQLRKAA